MMRHANDLDYDVSVGKAVRAVRAGGFVVVTAPTYRRGDDLLRDLAHALIDAGENNIVIKRALSSVQIKNGGRAELILDARHLRGSAPNAVWAPHGTASEEFSAHLRHALSRKGGEWL